MARVFQDHSQRFPRLSRHVFRATLAGGGPLRGLGHRAQRLHQPRRPAAAEFGEAEEWPGNGPAGWERWERWDVYWKSMRNLWDIYDIYEIFMGNLWELYGIWKFVGILWDIYWKSMGNLWEQPGTIWKRRHDVGTMGDVFIGRDVCVCVSVSDSKPENCLAENHHCLNGCWWLDFSGGMFV